MINVEYTDKNGKEIKKENLTYGELFTIIERINKWVTETEPQENPTMLIEFN